MEALNTKWVGELHQKAKSDVISPRLLSAVQFNKNYKGTSANVVHNSTFCGLGWGGGVLRM